MNYNTLNTGSIVSYKGNLHQVLNKDDKCILTINKDSENTTFWYKPKFYFEKSVSDLQPVPITPELLEKIKAEKLYGSNFENWEYRYMTDLISITISKYVDVYCIRIYTGEEEHIIKNSYGFNLHDFQHFLKGVEGIDFTIELKDLEGLEIK